MLFVCVSVQRGLFESQAGGIAVFHGVGPNAWPPLSLNVTGVPPPILTIISTTHLSL